MKAGSPELEILKEPNFDLVVEIEPYSYSDRESPLGSPGVVTDEQFQRYLSDCLEDAGLDHLVPVKATSMFYAVRGIDRDSLSALVKNELSRWPEDEDYSNLENVAEYGSGFSGGIVILERDQCVSSPGCCCGLDCLIEWRQVLDDRPSDWLELWTGHDADSLEVKFHQPEQEFCFRLSKWETGLWDRQFTLSSHSFEEAIERLEQIATGLSAMIEDVLSERFSNPHCRLAIARRIAGLA